MADEHWYRNTRWDTDIEASFNAKLSRSRGQKAQYLRIQGATLKDTHPIVAVELLNRCVAMDEEFHVAHAHLNIAEAYIALGDIESALKALEAAMDQEARFPMFRTSAPFDYCMLVAHYYRTERYDRALVILDHLGQGPFASTDFQAQAARALIYWELGELALARGAAEMALPAEAVEVGWIPSFPDVGVVPNAESAMCKRIREIAESGM